MSRHRAFLHDLGNNRVLVRVIFNGFTDHSRLMPLIPSLRFFVKFGRKVAEAGWISNMRDATLSARPCGLLLLLGWR